MKRRCVGWVLGALGSATVTLGCGASGGTGSGGQGGGGGSSVASSGSHAMSSSGVGANGGGGASASSTSAGPGAGGSSVTSAGSGGAGGAGAGGATTSTSGAGGAVASSSGTGGGGPLRLVRPSKAGTIALSNDEALVAMVNPTDGTVAVFGTADDKRIGAPIAVGSEPSSIVFGPDPSTAYVSLRGSSGVEKLTGVGSLTPVIGTPVTVGSEPTGLALSPSGSLLFVAEWAQSRVDVIDTATMSIIHSLAVDRPRALAVTNQGASDADELLVVPSFYGVPGPGEEATDTSRTGKVHVFGLDAAFTNKGTIDLLPRAIGASSVAGISFAPSTSANQLGSVAISGKKAYVTSISASPSGVPNFASNVYPVVWVLDLVALNEDTGPDGTVNVFEAIQEQIASGNALMAGDLIDLDVDPTGVAYVLSRAGNMAQRVQFTATGPVLGVSGTPQIDMNGGCQVPIGIVATSTTKAYVNCWNSFNLGVVDLGTQALLPVTADQQSVAIVNDDNVNHGRKFFFTGRGRWSADATGHAGVGAAWSSCGSCHPDGYSDNITWSFPAGPRQTTSLDGTFAHGTVQAGKQRVLNWTAVFDEIADFERNTRAVSGGLGAFTQGACGTAGETQDTCVTATNGLAGGVSSSGQQNPSMLDCGAQAGECGSHANFDDIEAWIKVIRPPHAPASLDAASVARGRALFDQGGNGASCVQCHGGGGWTLSRRFYAPTSGTNTQLTTAVFSPPTPNAPWPSTWTFYGVASDSFMLQRQPKAAEAGGINIAPNQVGCAIRNVATFGPDALEVNQTGQRAQGKGGYNIPSLYGLSLGAPFLHDGKATSLTGLLDPNGAFAVHLTTANALFAPSPQDLQDLVNFLLSIDASTAEFDVPVDGSSRSFDGCPSAFP